MNPEMRTSGFMRTLLFSSGITAVCISAVASLQGLTASRIRSNEALFLKRAVYEAHTGEPAGGREAVESWFNERVKRAQGTNGSFTVVDPKTDVPAGTVHIRTGAGLWGPITAVVGVSPSGDLTGIAFTEQNETPGLGARIAEAWFIAQFRGKRPPVRLLPEGTRSPGTGDIDAITGATITSRAVMDIVNNGGPK